MRNVYRVLAYLLAIEVVIQAMAIAYGIAGVAHWVEEDGGVLNKQVFDSDDPDFTGIGGFITHGINGTMIIPIIVILLLIVSFFAKVPGGVRWALYVFGLVVLQFMLAFVAFSVPVIGALHGINAIVLLGVAGYASRRVGRPAAARASTEAPAAGAQL
jgi:hypothetical protein